MLVGLKKSPNITVSLQSIHTFLKYIPFKNYINTIEENTNYKIAFHPLNNKTKDMQCFAFYFANLAIPKLLAGFRSNYREENKIKNISVMYIGNKSIFSI